MFSKEKIGILLSSAATGTLGFFLAYSNPYPEEIPLSVTTKPERFGLFTKNENQRTVSLIAPVSSERDFAHFIQKLKGNLTSEDCERILEDLLSNNEVCRYSNRKMVLLMEKWGSIAPRQALQKMANISEDSTLTGCIFGAWAAQNPETAVTFYTESEDPLIKKNNIIPRFLTAAWAAHDPQKCWNWLQEQREGNIPEETVRSCQENIIFILISKFPERLPGFLEKTDYLDWQRNGFELGEKILSQTNIPPEWMEKLPKKIKIEAEAGRIMGTTQGSLPEIAAQLSKMDTEKQKDLLKELADPILEANRLDIKERINWLVDTFPAESLPSQLKDRINSWMMEDVSARPWIDSLPPGRKKDLFMKIYNSQPKIITVR